MKKILIIEDDKKLSSIISDFLIFSKSYEVLCSYNGKDGLSTIYNWRPDLVLLDVMLPELDGFEICKKIKDISLDERPKIIIVTVLSKILDDMQSNWLKEIEADAFISKPIDMMELRNTVDFLISQKKA